MKAKPRLKTTVGAPISKVVQPGQAHYVMIEKSAMYDMDKLMVQDRPAARLIMALIRLMEPGSGGVVVASNKALQELLGVSESTVARSLRTLIKGQWVQRIRIGGAYALAVNKEVAWVGPRGQLDRAVFQATVIAARSEQDEAALNPGPLKQIPMAHPDEKVIAVGREPDPPVQHMIEGTEPVAVTGRGKARVPAVTQAKPKRHKAT